ncbi:glycosyltransferase [Alteromonas gracilis]|uniref:glycosyltransferase n=1 Tax=Alteromonas gracilis TaxID=1479524 RepID=UPI0030CAA062
MLLPSHNEGLPIAILEAMSAGLAVISTTVGGIPEAIPDTRSGLLIEPGDKDALSDAIEKFITDNAQLAEAARLSRERYDSAYSSAANVKIIKDVLAKLLNNELSASR